MDFDIIDFVIRTAAYTAVGFSFCFVFFVLTASVLHKVRQKRQRREQQQYRKNYQSFIH